MKRLLLCVAAILAPSMVFAGCIDGVWEGTWAGPSPEPPSCDVFVEPDTADNELCFPEGCSAISYSWDGALRSAKSTMPNGYQVFGWSGPCLTGDCPEIDKQAYSSLFWNSRQLYRYGRYVQQQNQ
jgi:hypothetical protein